MQNHQNAPKHKNTHTKIYLLTEEIFTNVSANKVVRQDIKQQNNKVLQQQNVLGTYLANVRTSLINTLSNTAIIRVSKAAKMFIST